MNVIGAVRVGKFAKYLPEFDWKPIVLTINKMPRFSQILPIEMDEANIIRTPYFYLAPTLASPTQLSSQDVASTKLTSKASFRSRAVYKLLSLIGALEYMIQRQLPILDNLLSEPTGWYFHAVKKGLKILNQGDIDVIFSSSQPRTSHLIASRLHQKTKIPWVAEYRDLWVDPYRNKSCFYQFFETKLEKRVMKGCQVLITVSEFTVTRLEAIHSKKVEVIHNGYDEQDYSENIPLTSKFTLTYTGNIYVGKRDPTLLFQAIAELQEEGKFSPADFEVRFFGGSSLKTLLPIIENYNIVKLVKIYDPIPFKQSIVRQQESSALLLLEWDDPHAKHVFSGKIFEYLGARRPILAIAYKGGAISELLDKSGCGRVVTEVEEIKALLQKWLGEFKEYGEITSYYHPDVKVIKSYTRREGAEKLARVLDEVTSLSKNSVN